MTAETQEIRTLARDFAAAELRPHNERWDAERTLDEDVVGKVAELGFFGMLVPEADGGMGFDAAVYAAALEELAWGEPAVAVLLAQSVIAADLIARHAQGETRASWLATLAAGEQTACIAFVEDRGAADGAADGAEDGATGGAEGSADDGLQTRAERDGDGWRVRGSKRWVTHGAGADLFLVLAATDSGNAIAVVPREGVTVQQRAATLGLRPLHVVDIEVDARIEADALLGGSGGIGEDVDAGDALGRLSTAAVAVGIAQAALEHAIRYAGEREQFGRPIRSFEGIQAKLASMATRTAAARALVERAAASMDDTVASAMAKLAASECAMFVTTEAVQVFGGYGYMRDYPVEKLMRDAKATEIMHGPSEVQRVRIAESLHV